jgi:hypothetical protein
MQLAVGLGRMLKTGRLKYNIAVLIERLSQTSAVTRTGPVSFDVRSVLYMPARCNPA